MAATRGNALADQSSDDAGTRVTDQLADVTAVTEVLETRTRWLMIAVAALVLALVATDRFFAHNEESKVGWLDGGWLPTCIGASNSTSSDARASRTSASGDAGSRAGIQEFAA